MSIKHQCQYSDKTGHINVTLEFVDRFAKCEFGNNCINECPHNLTEEENNKK